MLTARVHTTLITYIICIYNMALFLGFMQVFSLFRSYFLDNADPCASRVYVVLGSVIMLTI